MNILAIAGTNMIGPADRRVKLGEAPLDRAARKTLDILTEAGHTTEAITLRGQKIEFCNHCDVCWHEETCPLKDSFWPIYEKMKAADAIIFYAPITSAMINPKLATLLQRTRKIARKEKRLAGKLGGLFTEEVRRGGDLGLEQFLIWFEDMQIENPLVARVVVGRRADGRHLGREEMEDIRLQKADEMAAAISAAGAK